MTVNCYIAYLLPIQLSLEGASICLKYGKTTHVLTTASQDAGDASLYMVCLDFAGVQQLYLSLHTELGASQLPLCTLSCEFHGLGRRVTNIHPIHHISACPNRGECGPPEGVVLGVFQVQWTMFPCSEMQRPPHHIYLCPKAPSSHSRCTSISPHHHFCDKFKWQLEEDMQRGITEPIPAGEPTEWCSYMVVLPKKDRQPRRTVDLQRLNWASLQAIHLTCPPFDAIT